MNATESKHLLRPENIITVLTETFYCHDFKTKVTQSLLEHFPR